MLLNLKNLLDQRVENTCLDPHPMRIRESCSRDLGTTSDSTLHYLNMYNHSHTYFFILKGCYSKYGNGQVKMFFVCYHISETLSICIIIQMYHTQKKSF